MLIGVNPRREAAVLNARIRKRYLKGNVLLGLVGEKADLTYPYNYLGAGPESLAQFVEHAPAKKDKPMFIIGQGALNRADGAAVLAMAAKAAASLGVVKDGWNGFNILHNEAALPGALDIGFVPGEGGMDTGAMLAAKARSTYCSCSASTKSKCRRAASSSISAPMATAARTAPT